MVDLEKYDVVYFVKDSTENEELVYSIRSVVKNFPYRRIVIYGTQPKNLQVDKYYHVVQGGWTKWDRVQKMVTKACLNNNLTEYIWLFNDDFYVTRPVTEYCYYTNGKLSTIINNFVKRFGYETAYVRMLKYMTGVLKKNGLTTDSFATHTPMLINRKHFLECMEKMAGVRGFRSLYGNYEQCTYKLPYPLVKEKDTKVRDEKEEIRTTIPFLSSSDKTFETNEKMRRFLFETFKDKTKYER